MNALDDLKMMDIKDAAAETGRSVKALRAFISVGELIPIRNGERGRMWFTRGMLREFVARKEAEAVARAHAKARKRPTRIEFVFKEEASAETPDVLLRRVRYENEGMASRQFKDYRPRPRYQAEETGHRTVIRLSEEKARRRH